MDIEDLPAPLLRLKILIWVHSAIGALLLAGLPLVALATDHQGLATGSLPGLFIWCFGFAPLRKKAEDLAPDDRIAPTKPPGWIPPLVFIAAFLSPGWLLTPFSGWLVAVWLSAAVTIALRWMISRRLSLAVHGETWALVLAALSIPIVFGAMLLWYFIGSIGC